MEFRQKSRVVLPLQRHEFEIKAALLENLYKGRIEKQVMKNNEACLRCYYVYFKYIFLVLF